MLFYRKHSDVPLLPLSILLLSGASAVGAACSTAGTSFMSALTQKVTAVATCGVDLSEGAVDVQGYGASACNAEQSTYAAMNQPLMAAYAGVCYCKETYYNKIITLADVDAWTTCVGPWNTLVVQLGKLTVDYVNAHGPQLFSDCNVCADSKFPPVSEELEQAQAILDFALDWRQELLNREVDLLKEGVQTLVTTALFNGGVPNGASSPTADFVVSSITKGYGASTGGTKQKRESSLSNISPRQTSNSSDPALQPISEIIGIQVKALMVPVNGTLDMLEQQMKGVFTNTTWKDTLLQQWKGNLTQVTVSRVTGDANANKTESSSNSASGTGTATETGGAASSSTKASGAKPGYGGRESSVFIAGLSAALFLALS